MKSTCDRVKFINPKYGTKFLLLQRLSEDAEQNGNDSVHNTVSCTGNINTATASSSHSNQFNRPSVSNTQKVNNFNHNGNGFPPRKRKRKRKQWNRVNQSNCYPPIPIMSREPVILGSNKVSDQPAALPIAISAIATSPSLSDDSRLTGSITQEIFQNKNNHRQDFHEILNEKSLDLSISEESRARVTLTPFKEISPHSSHNTEQEVIIISSDSSNKTESSEKDSNSISPSLLDGTSNSEFEKSEGSNISRKNNSDSMCIGLMKKRSISSTLPARNVKNKSFIPSTHHSDIFLSFQTSKPVQNLLTHQDVSTSSKLPRRVNSNEINEKEKAYDILNPQHSICILEKSHSNISPLEESAIKDNNGDNSKNSWSCVENNCYNDDSVRTIYHSLTHNTFSYEIDKNRSNLSDPAFRDGKNQSNHQAITDSQLVSTNLNSFPKENILFRSTSTEVNSSENNSGDCVEINKKGHKCLKLILAVLASDFEVSQNECFQLLKNNKYNILATILDLQTRNVEA